MWLIHVCVGIALLCDSNAEFGSLVVRTASGTVNGWERVSRDGRLYQAWTGIPYGEPSVGELRFKSPKPKSPWDGVLDVTGDAPPCLQSGKMVIGAPGNPGPVIIGAEDCLFLNVYRPKINKEDLPVLVHIHGGAFQGGNMGTRENADYLMDEDVVLVGIQYRLNAFGFMSLGDAVLPGNFGLKDQVLALKWVKENIARFGGNPNSVTVFGESAGAKSAHIMLKSPATDGLVHRAVSNSGSICRFCSILQPDSVRRYTLSAAKKCGCPSENSQEVLKCLQHLDANMIMTCTRGDPSVYQFMPVIEPEDAEDAVATSDLSLRPTEKPWMTSTVPGEWLLPKIMMGVANKTVPTDVRRYLIEYLSNEPINMSTTQILGAAEIFEKFYFSPTDLSSQRSDGASKLQADECYVYPALFNIRMHRGPKWMFRFEYVSARSSLINKKLNITEPVAFHASTGFSYSTAQPGRFSTSSGSGTVENPKDYEVSKRMIKYLVNFAYYDDPTPEPSPFKWKQYKDGEILRVTAEGDYLADEKYLAELADFYTLWDTVIGWKSF